jgi:hypothetical protein
MMNNLNLINTIFQNYCINEIVAYKQNIRRNTLLLQAILKHNTKKIELVFQNHNYTYIFYKHNDFSRIQKEDFIIKRHNVFDLNMNGNDIIISAIKKNDNELLFSLSNGKVYLYNINLNTCQLIVTFKEEPYLHAFNKQNSFYIQLSDSIDLYTNNFYNKLSIKSEGNLYMYNNSLYIHEQNYKGFYVCDIDLRNAKKYRGVFDSSIKGFIFAGWNEPLTILTIDSIYSYDLRKKQIISFKKLLKKIYSEFFQIDDSHLVFHNKGHLVRYNFKTNKVINNYVYPLSVQNVITLKNHYVIDSDIINFYNKKTFKNDFSTIDYKGYKKYLVNYNDNKFYSIGKTKENSIFIESIQLPEFSFDIQNSMKPILRANSDSLVELHKDSFKIYYNTRNFQNTRTINIPLVSEGNIVFFGDNKYATISKENYNFYSGSLFKDKPNIKIPIVQCEYLKMKNNSQFASIWGNLLFVIDLNSKAYVTHSLPYSIWNFFILPRSNNVLLQKTEDSNCDQIIYDLNTKTVLMEISLSFKPYILVTKNYFVFKEIKMREREVVLHVYNFNIEPKGTRTISLEESNKLCKIKDNRLYFGNAKDVLIKVIDL